MKPITARAGLLTLLGYLLATGYGLLVMLQQPIRVDVGISQLDIKRVNALLIGHYGSRLDGISWNADQSLTNCNRLNFRATETVFDQPTLLPDFLNQVRAAGGIECGAGLRWENQTPGFLVWLPLLALGAWWLIVFWVPTLLKDAESTPLETLQSRVVRFASQCCLVASLMLLGTMIGRLLWLLLQA